MVSALRSSFQTTPASSARISDQGRGRPLAAPGLKTDAAGPGPVWESNVDPVTQGAIDRVLDHLRQRELAPQFSASGNLVDLSVRLSTALRAIIDDPMLQDDVNIMTAHLVHWMCDYGERSGVDRMSIQLATLELSSGQSPVLSVADNGFLVPLVSETRAQHISKRIADPGHHLKLDLKMNAPSARPSATGDLIGPGGGGSAALSGPVAQLMFTGEPVQADNMRPLAHRADLEFLRSNAAQLSVVSVSELAGAVARLIDVQVGASVPSALLSIPSGPQAVMNGGDAPVLRSPLNDPMFETAQALYPGLAVALPERPVALGGGAPLPRGMDAPLGPTMSSIMPVRAANDPVMQSTMTAPVAAGQGTGPTTAPIAPTPIAITPSAAPNPLATRSDIPASSVTVHSQQSASSGAAPVMAAPTLADPQSAVPPVASPMPMGSIDPVLSVKSVPEPATMAQPTAPEPAISSVTLPPSLPATSTAPQTAALPVSPLLAPVAVDTTVAAVAARSSVEPSSVLTQTAPTGPERALDMSSPAASIVASTGPVRVDDQTPTVRMEAVPTLSSPPSSVPPAPVQDRRSDVVPLNPPGIIARADVKTPDAPVNPPPGHQPISVAPPVPDVTGPPLKFPDPTVDRINPAPPKEPDVDRRPHQPNRRPPEPIKANDPAKVGGDCGKAFCECAKNNRDFEEVRQKMDHGNDPKPSFDLNADMVRKMAEAAANRKGENLSGIFGSKCGSDGCQGCAQDHPEMPQPDPRQADGNAQSSSTGGAPQDPTNASGSDQPKKRGRGKPPEPDR